MTESRSAMPQRRLSWLALLATIAILLASAVLGAYRMHGLSFWYDEVASIDFTVDLMGTLHRFPDQMPAYFIILRGWLALVGQSEVAGRWLSLLFGLLAVSVTRRLARRYASTQVALLTIVTLASSAVFLRYYREMRTYSLMALLGAASMWFYLAWLNSGRRRDAIGYVLVTGLMVYSHFFAGLLVTAQGLYTLGVLVSGYLMRPAVGQQIRRAWITIGLHVVTGLLLVPYLGIYLGGLSWVTTGGRHPAALTTPQALDSMTRAVTNDSLAFCALLLLVALASPHRKLLRAALVWLMVPVLMVFVVHAFFIPVFVNPRYLLFVWPALAVVLALGIDALSVIGWRSPRPQWIAAGVLVIVGVAQVYNNLPAMLPGVLTDEPWREVFTTVGAEAKPTDLVMTNMVDLVGVTGYREPLAYYFRNNAPGGMTAPIELDVLPSLVDVPQRVSQATGAWFLVTDGEPNSKGQAAIQMLRAAGYADCRRWTYNKTSLTEWQRLRAPFADFGGQIRMSAEPLNTTRASYHSGETLTLALGFTALQPPALNYSVGLYVVPVGEPSPPVFQQDGPPANQQTSTWQPGAAVCDVHRLTVPSAPGSYTVLVAIYDSQSGQRLAVDPARTENSVQLFTFVVR